MNCDIYIGSGLMLLLQDEMSFKSRTETSAKWWQGKEGKAASHHLHILISPPPLHRDIQQLLQISIIQSFTFIIIIRHLDE